MAATTKLIVYNEALRELAASPLVNLVTANQSKLVLDTAFDQAVEYTLAKADWNFARRRAVLVTTPNTGMPPYTVDYTKPADYLRKVWLKRAADDEFQIDHAEIASFFYGHVSQPLLEYISDTAANYDPANWPPHFTRILVVYLALLAAPALARAGADEIKLLYDKLDRAEADAVEAEAVFTSGIATDALREPVFRRALELMGQQLTGTLATQSHLDKLKWHMNKAWTHTVRFCLEQGAWNFATRRLTLTGGAEVMPGGAQSGPTLPDFEGYEYGYLLPSNFRHKIWLKADATHAEEIPHQRLGSAVFCNALNVVLEYVAEDAHSTTIANWPATFVDLVAAQLALTVAAAYVVEMGGRGGTVKASQMRRELAEIYERKLSDARNKDAIQQYPVPMIQGSWVSARAGSRINLR